MLWFGGHRVNDGTLQVGALVAFMSYLMQILMSVMMAHVMLAMGAARGGVRRTGSATCSAPIPRSATAGARR